VFPIRREGPTGRTRSERVRPRQRREPLLSESVILEFASRKEVGASRERPPHEPQSVFPLLLSPNMKKWLALIGMVAFLASGCASLTEFKFVRPDDKPSPFIPDRNPYRPPQDPASNY